MAGDTGRRLVLKRLLGRKRTQNHMSELEKRMEEKKANIMQIQAQAKQAAAAAK